MKVKNDKGLTLVELLVLLVVAGLVAVLAVPNMAMANNRARMQETLHLAHSVAAAIEASRAEFRMDDFVAKVNGLNQAGELSVQECPWLVPAYLEPRSLRAPFGGRLSFSADPLTGQVNVGAPGKGGVLEFALNAAPLRYELTESRDFYRGVVFRDGVLVIGPRNASADR